MSKKKIADPKVCDSVTLLSGNRMQRAAELMQSAAQQMAAATANGVAVDVNVQGNAQATLRGGNGNVYSGASYAQTINNVMLGD